MDSDPLDGSVSADACARPGSAGPRRPPDKVVDASAQRLCAAHALGALRAAARPRLERDARPRDTRDRGPERQHEGQAASARYTGGVHRPARAVAAFWRKAYGDNLTGLASMVAYSLLLSIFPLALIALFVAGRVLRAPELADSVIADVQRLFPTAARGTITSGVRRLEHASTTVGLVAIVSSLWVSASFWGALDTAFCRIYELPCRTWVRQKLFGLGMLVVVLVLIAASVLVPTLQSVLVNGASDLPLGLDRVRGLVYAITFAAGLLVLFVALCITYWAVPKGQIPWAAVWPGAVG